MICYFPMKFMSQRGLHNIKMRTNGYPDSAVDCYFDVSSMHAYKDKVIDSSHLKEEI